MTLLVTIMLVNADDSKEIKIDEEEGEPPMMTTAMFDEQVVDKLTLEVKGSKPWFIKFTERVMGESPQATVSPV